MISPARPDRLDGSRIDRGPIPLRLTWIVGCAFVLLLFVRDFLQTKGGLIGTDAFWGRDFINVWTGGLLVREGRVGLLFDPHAYAVFQRSLFGPVGPHFYSYPPVSYPLAALFSMLPYPLALASWLGGTGALFTWAARPWWPERAGPAWLAILTPAALVNVWAGHYGFLVGALFLLGFRMLDENPRRAGIFFGLMLIKPHLAVLVPLVLLIRRQREAISSAAATVAVLLAATTLLYGLASWDNFLFRTGAIQASLIDARSSFFGLMSPSVATAVLKLGGGWPLAVVAQLAAAAFAVALIARCTLAKVPTRDLALLAATATFLVLPYSFNYDMTVVMIGALAVMTDRDTTVAEQRLALCGFVGPQIGMLLSAMHMPLMPLTVVGLAWAQSRIALRKAGAAATPDHAVPAIAA